MPGTPSQVLEYFKVYPFHIPPPDYEPSAKSNVTESAAEPAPTTDGFYMPQPM